MNPLDLRHNTPQHAFVRELAAPPKGKTYNVRRAPPEARDATRAILHAYATQQGMLAGQSPDEALRGFYVWLLQHEVRP